MTDATDHADAYAAGAQSSSERAAPPAPWAAPNTAADPQPTSGYGTVAGEEVQRAPDSGATTAWPAMEWPGVVRPAGWFLSAYGEAAPPVRPRPEPARSDAADPAVRPPAAWPSSPESPAPEPSAAWPSAPEPPTAWPSASESSAPEPSAAWAEPEQHRQPEQYLEEQPAADPYLADPQPTSVYQVPAVGSTHALRGWPGGPGFPVPPGAVPGLLDQAQRSGWQLAQDLWQDSGIDWEPADKERVWPGGGGDLAAEGAQTRADLPAVTSAGAEEGAGETIMGWAPRPSAQPAFHRADAVPLGAPVAAPVAAAGNARVRTRTYAQADSQALDRPPYQPEPDELFRAWQGSVRDAARPRAVSSRRRRQLWQAASIGVPAAVIVTVGIGALMMLTGRANDMLAVRANTGNPAGNGSGAGDVPAAFAGYPGQHGTVTVGSLTAAAGAQLAVGSADGHPAIWRRPATGRTSGGGGAGGTGTWTLVSQAIPAIAELPGTGGLVAVAHGPAGWIAVGRSVAGATSRPVVVTSADGVSWRPLAALAGQAGAGTEFTGVAAGHGGYAVVGRRMAGGRTFAVMWWSADLKTWQRADNGGLDGRLKASAAYAVAPTASGFVAVGAHGANPIIWTSPDGHRWTGYDVPAPSGASAATFRAVTVNGTRIAAAGFALTQAGNLPFAVVSAGGGAGWREVVLGTPSGLGTVTSLTAAAGGFVAAGQAGTAGGDSAVTWTTANGISWSPAAPAGGSGATAITALTAAGGGVLGVAQHGADPLAVTVTAP